MLVESPDRIHSVRIKRKNRMTTETRNKIDSIAFAGCLSHWPDSCSGLSSYDQEYKRLHALIE